MPHLSTMSSSVAKKALRRRGKWGVQPMQANMAAAQRLVLPKAPAVQRRQRQQRQRSAAFT